MVPRHGSLEETERTVESELLALLGDPPELDVALLGVGQDGHVASLFPGHPVLREGAWVRSVSDSPKAPARRLTLTLDTLLRARAVVVGVFGAKKAPVIAEALSDRASQLPVARVLRGARECFLFLDPAAAIER
jgi:6-phosphogluconolactonase